MLVNHTLPLRRLINSTFHMEQINARGLSVLPLLFIKSSKQKISNYTDSKELQLINQSK
jgi:hypothetical protein